MTFNNPDRFNFSKTAVIQNRTFRALCLALMLLSTSGTITIFSTVKAGAARTIQSGDLTVAQGIDLFKKRQYKAALDKFEQANKQNAGSLTVQYYLGMSALQTQQNVTARDALSRVVVMTTKNDKLHVSCNSLLNKYFNCTPYSCLTFDLKTPGVVRWERSAMPLKIYISDGKWLPEVFTGKRMDLGQLKQVIHWTKSAELMQRLPIAPGYKSQYRTYAMEGLKEWDWAVKENLLTYEVVEDHREADVIVFGCRILYDLGSYTYLNKDGPALMFFATESFASKNPQQSLVALSAHEFGHAWGLQHSENSNDVMFAQPMEGQARGCSESDRVTLRALYSIPPKIVLHSVKGGNKGK